MIDDSYRLIVCCLQSLIFFTKRGFYKTFSLTRNSPVDPDESQAIDKSKKRKLSEGEDCLIIKEVIFFLHFRKSLTLTLSLNLLFFSTVNWLWFKGLLFVCCKMVLTLNQRFLGIDIKLNDFKNL